MMTMRELIAKAVHETIWLSPKFQNVPPEGRARYLEIADAVLAEMEEPTEEMVTAAWRRSLDDADPDSLYAKVWRAMIRAANQ